MDVIEISLSNDSLSSANESTMLGKDLVYVNEDLKPIIDYLLITTLVIIMLSMGCEITWTQLKNHMRRPVGICIGLASQFFIMPLTAYTLMRSADVSGLYATGILIISCCPGGVLSNAFTLFCDGDLSLSVAMTSFSTLGAMGMMPLNIWIYGHSFETQDLVLPYGNLALSLISVTTPVGVGMLIRWKLPMVAKLITKLASCIGPLLVIGCIVFEVIVFPDLFVGVPSKMYGIILSLPLLGLTLGYVLAFSFRQNMPVRKTIAIECGVQNVPTALTIISLSFKPELQKDIILLPWLYGFAMMTGCTVLCLIYQIHKRYQAYRAKKENGFDLQPQVGGELILNTEKRLSDIYTRSDIVPQIALNRDILIWFTPTCMKI